MSKLIKMSMAVCAVTVLILAAGTARANWSESWDGDEPDLPTWEFHCFPDVTKTFTNTIKTEPSGNKYLSLDETTSYNTDVGSYGSAFGAGFGSDEVFTDVRMGAVFNVTGDASRNYCGFAARTEYFIDDGSVTGAPGMFATQTYVMHVNWEDGPANLRIDIEKVVNMQNIMRNEEALGLELAVPGLNHARSYYAELDILGSGPVYVTGFLYEYKGGPLVAKTATMVDTNGNDPWEDEGEHDEVFTSGVSAVFAQNEQEEPAGYHCTFDDIFSVSDGPAAVYPGPADGATGVSINADLSWVEAAFATSRELWFGKKGAMQKITPPGKTYDPGPLEFGQTYEWRVDQIGASSTVTGHTWSFTTEDYLVVDDIEGYTDFPPDRVFDTWKDGWVVPENGSAVGYSEAPYLETGIVHGGGHSMPFAYNTNDTVNYGEAVADTADLDVTPDWAGIGASALTLYFRGRIENAEQAMYVRLEDAAANAHTVTHPHTHAVQSESWHAWDIDLKQFSDEGVNLGNVKKVCIGFGDKTGATTWDGSGQMYFDDIRLYPARCFNLAGLNLSGDANGDCKVDFGDLAALAEGWLNNGLAPAP